MPPVAEQLKSAEDRLRLDAGRQGIAAWERQHGALTAEVLAGGLAGPGRCWVARVRSTQRREALATAEGYTSVMTKTSVVVDRDIAEQAARILGTSSLRDTIDASLREVVLAQRRLELIDLLSEDGRFDFEATRDAWGGQK